MTDEAVPPTGWHIRLETDAGAVYRPEVSEAEWNPSVNDKPSADLTVPREDERWLGEATDRADAKAWVDGRRVALDRLVDAESTRGRSAETTLELTGGVELDRRVQKDVDRSPAHEVVEDLLDEHTDYVANVDEPDAEPIEDQIRQDASSESGFEVILEEVLEDAEHPATTTEDGLPTVEQTAWWFTADEGDITTGIDLEDEIGTIEAFDDTVSAGDVAVLLNDIDSGEVVLFEEDSGDYIEVASVQADNVEYTDVTIDDDVTHTGIRDGSETTQNATVLVDTDDDGDSNTSADDVHVFEATDTGPEAGLVTNAEANGGFNLDVEPAYTLDEEHLGVAIHARQGFNVDETDELRLDANGDDETDVTWKIEDLPTDSYSWETIEDFTTDDETESATLPADEETTLSFDVQVGSGERGDHLLIDAVVVYDTRWYDPDDSGDFPDELDDDDRFEAPREYGGVDLVGEDEQSELGFIDAELTIDVDVTEPDVTKQRIGISTDGGDSWEESPENATGFQDDFDDPVTRVTAKVELSSHGTRSDASPSVGTDPQVLESWLLETDVANEPFLIDESFDDDLIDVLREIADKTGALFEVRWDRDNNTMAVEWTRPGQREGDATLSPSQLQVERDASTIVEAATVVGGRRTRSDESVTASVGEAVDLRHSRVITGTEEVRQAPEDDEDEDDTESYDRNVDYRIGRFDGTITALEDGDIDDGEELVVDYEFKIDGRFESDDWDDSPETDVRVDVPGLTSESACEQAATRLTERQSSARLEAQVDLADVGPDVSVVETLSVDQLPEAVSDGWEVREVIDAADSSQVLLGSGRTVEDEVEQIRREIGGVERRV